MRIGIELLVGLECDVVHAGTCADLPMADRVVVAVALMLWCLRRLSNTYSLASKATCDATDSC